MQSTDLTSATPLNTDESSEQAQEVQGQGLDHFMDMFTGMIDEIGLQVPSSDDSWAPWSPVESSFPSTMAPAVSIF
jgi:hypothetical protein